MDDFLRIGTITTVHGVHGEVKVFPTTDDINRFKVLKEVYCEIKNKKCLLHIESVKYFKNIVIIKFKEYTDRDIAETLRGCDIYVDRENAIPLADDEYFLCDAIGSRVITDEDEYVGILEDILQTGANDVFVVKTDENKEILIPSIKECILDINTDEKIVKIHKMKGLF